MFPVLWSSESCLSTDNVISQVICVVELGSMLSHVYNCRVTFRSNLHMLRLVSETSASGASRPRGTSTYLTSCTRSVASALPWHLRHFISALSTFHDTGDGYVWTVWSASLERLGTYLSAQTTQCHRAGPARHEPPQPPAARRPLARCGPRVLGALLLELLAHAHTCNSESGIPD